MKKTLLLLIICLTTIFYATAQNFAQVQSGLIYHFTKYVEWPVTMRSGDFVIGIVGTTDVSKFLQALSKSKKAGSQPIVVKKFKNVAEVTKCHIIYLPQKKSKEFTAALTKSVQNNSLLITEKNGLGKKGASINFIVQGGKPKFEVNKTAIQKAKLKINDKLVALGIVVG